MNFAVVAGYHGYMELWFASNVLVYHGDKFAMVGIELCLFVETNHMFPLLTMELGALGFYGQQTT
jgi:hypothetical protein